MAVSEQPVKLGLIGCGEVTRAKHLPAIMAVPGLSVVAVADPKADRCERVAGEFNIPLRYPDVRELLEQKQIEAVGICVPPDAHADVAAEVIRAGRHVWIDKPLALSVDECRRIIAEAAPAPIVAMTGFHMRFHRLVRQARDLIRGGVLGELESIRAVWHAPRADQNLPKWRKRRSTGGGALMEIAVHHFDLFRFLLGSEIETIFALGRDGVRDDECAVVSARMANGMLVTAEFSERAPHEIGIVANGSAGQLHLDCLRFDGMDVRRVRELPGAPRMRLRSAARFMGALSGGLRVLHRGGDYRDSYRAAWDHFAHVIRSGGQPEATLDDGLRATEAACAAAQSRRCGGPVAVAG
jgi:myo-inositol 2-dehydrogenase / D-chiro-inositol 1-dehydrogenase